jgi:hypothetical protein
LLVGGEADAVNQFKFECAAAGKIRWPDLRVRRDAGGDEH